MQLEQLALVSARVFEKLQVTALHQSLLVMQAYFLEFGLLDLQGQAPLQLLEPLLPHPLKHCLSTLSAHCRNKTASRWLQKTRLPE
jgi:hypothetical protein